MFEDEDFEDSPRVRPSIQLDPIDPEDEESEEEVEEDDADYPLEEDERYDS